MALAAKTLSGLGKAVTHTGGAVLKGGARIFGDDAVRAVGRGVNKIDTGLNKMVSKAVKQDEIYRNAVRGVKEAEAGVSDAARKALGSNKPINNYAKNTSFSYDGTSYRMRDVNGSKIYESKAKGAKDWTEITGSGKTKASSIYGEARSKYIAANKELENVADVAQDMAESAAGGFDGIPGWAKGAGLVAAGGIAGAMLASDD